MADTIVHVLMIAVCALLAVLAHDDVTAVAIVGLLIAATLAALTVLIGVHPWFALATAFCIAACAVPTWATLLPVVGCDAAYRIVEGACPRTRRARFALAAIPCAGAFVAALIALAHVTTNAPADESTIVALLLVPLTAVTSVAGYLRADGLRAQMRYRALADERRERLRLSHARINDVEASRAADMRRARLNERTRIAREIHDNVGHLLTRAIMMAQADQVVATTVGDDVHAAQFASLGTTLDEAMTMIRRSVHGLKDEGTDFHGMMQDAAAVSDASSLQVRLDDGIGQAPSALAHCFAAVIREALTNTVRHGTASHATVRLIDLPGLWQLVVQDDGGPITRTPSRSGGIGLADIEERARALGGNATCGPYAQGWRVFVSVPKTLGDDAAAAGTRAEINVMQRMEG